MNREAWRNEFNGRNILIWGYGREGKSSADLIEQLCPALSYTITDGADNALEQARKDHPHARVMAQKEVDFSAYDRILKAPGIVVPEGFDKTHLSGQTQLFLKHYRRSVIGITGTKGKSTTASLTATLLAAKYRVHLVGNIGVPCFEALPDWQEGDLAVFEISCHQLEFCSFSPKYAVFLNLYQEHLDHYGTYEKYGAAKANIYRHQETGDVLVAGKDLDWVLRERPDALRLGQDIRAEGRVLVIPDSRLKVTECALIGAHNYQNAAAAYYLANLFGVTDEEVLAGLKKFKPLHHRLEDLGVVDGIRFVNDSISTIGPSCIKALEALPETDTVLIGGMDRGISYAELEAYLLAHPWLHVVFMYASGQRIYQELRQRQDPLPAGWVLVSSLEEAVQEGKNLTRPGRICLLSPAASSYDHFKNFEERGEVFERLVKA